MRRSRSCETRPKTIDHRLTVYSLAATAAGVSMLALAQPAEAKVIITKKQIPLVAGKDVFLDLNHDGISDFEFEPTQFFSTTIGGQLLGHQTLTMKALTGGKAVGKQEFGKGPYASAFSRGANIGPSAHFSSAHGKITIERVVNCSCSQTAAYGNFSYYSPNKIYMGVKFQIKGETHYGWIRLKTPFIGGVPSEITAYAYESTANKRITIGETSASFDEAFSQPKPAGPSLGTLALGSDGVALWRREEKLGPPASGLPASS